MLVRKACLFRLRERHSQARDYARAAGCVRFVWNHTLALQRRYYRRFDKHLSYVRLANRLPAWKRRYAFLKEAPSQALQQALKDLDLAWQRFFKEPGRVGQPKFKGRHANAAFRLPQGVKLDANSQRLFLPKTGWVRLRLSRPVEGVIKNATVSREGGRWFVSLQTESEADLTPRTGTAVGVDLGAVAAATASDGSLLHLEARLSKYARRLRRQQRDLSRKHQGSNRRLRAKARLARTHARVAALRSDALHKYSRALVNKHAVICLEDLRVAAMTSSGGRRKAILNGRILSAGWAELRRQLEYKAFFSGGRAVSVNPAYTSQACSACGHVDAKNRRSQAEFRCLACGHAAHADHNAAINIRERGIQELLRAGTLAVAPGDTGAGRQYQVLRPLHVEAAEVGRPVKREPAEWGAQAALVGIPFLQGVEDVKKRRGSHVPVSRFL
jgi:putative transposase